MSQITHQDLPAGLTYVTDAEGGFTLEREGDTVTIRHPSGDPCVDVPVVERVRGLVIPPQWREVWISPHEHGYLQATGRDARGRKQYIYHPDYTAYRQRRKFDKLIGFAERLPSLREEVNAQLRRRTWDRERVLALMVKLLDRAHLRVGSQRYREEHETYGLTTLRRRHLTEDGNELRLCFNGKSGQFRRVSIRNRSLRRLVKEVSELPGYELFRYEGSDGRRHGLDSADVNDYLHERMGERYSAKDFRTWGGTSFAVRYYPEAQRRHAEGGERGKVETKVVKLVARELGNTVSVCREYYIHPAVLEAAKLGRLPGEPWPDWTNSAELSGFETFTLDLLRADRE